LAGQDDLSSTCAEAEGEFVHQGFHQAFLTMRQGIEFWLAMPEHRDKPVFLAGVAVNLTLNT
jgi:hypothetical protein